MSTSSSDDAVLQPDEPAIDPEDATGGLSIEDGALPADVDPADAGLQPEQPALVEDSKGDVDESELHSLTVEDG